MSKTLAVKKVKILLEVIDLLLKICNYFEQMKFSTTLLRSPFKSCLRLSAYNDNN